MQCPQCGSDTLQKVSAIWSQQTSRGTSSTSGGGLAFTGNGMAPIGMVSTTHSLSQTLLALQLDPPTRPIRTTCWMNVLWVTYGFFTLFFFLQMVIAVGQGRFISLVFDISLLIGLAFLGLRWFRRRSTRWAERLSNYQQAADAWDRAFYCHSCDSITHADAAATVVSESPA